MAWHLNGNWDCLTTPPGADVNDIALIMEQIARAINERVQALNDIGDGSPITLFQWFYNDAISTSTTYPTAAQFAGIRTDGACVRRFLDDAEQRVDTLADRFCGPVGATLGDTDNWTSSTLRTYASTGLGAFNLSKPTTYAPNWLILRNSINAMTIIKTSTASRISGLAFTTDSRIDTTGDVQSALGGAASATASEIYSVISSSAGGSGNGMIGSSVIADPSALVNFRFTESGRVSWDLDLSDIRADTPYLKSAKSADSTEPINDGLVVSATITGSYDPEITMLEIDPEWTYIFGGVSGASTSITSLDTISLSIPSSVLGTSFEVSTEFTGTTTPTESVVTFASMPVFDAESLSCVGDSPVIIWSIAPLLTIA